MAGEWQDRVSMHCCLFLAFDENFVQGHEAGCGEKEERSVGVVRNSSRIGFPPHTLFHTPSFLIPND